jgi:CheY-like chemotaxis protein
MERLCDMEKLKLLVVEDNPDDFDLFCFALRKSKVLCTATHAANSPEAIAYLDGWGKYSDRLDYPVPDVLILDLKLVGSDGFQVLKHVRSHPQYRLLPVIIFTSSSLEGDIQKAFQLGANSYFVKPAALSDMSTLIEILLNYWSWCRKPEIESGEVKHDKDRLSFERALAS